VLARSSIYQCVSREVRGVEAAHRPGGRGDGLVRVVGRVGPRRHRSVLKGERYGDILKLNRGGRRYKCPFIYVLHTIDNLKFPLFIPSQHLRILDRKFYIEKTMEEMRGTIQYNASQL